MEGTPPANRIRIGQTVYLVVSRVRVREAVVRRCDAGLYTVQFANTHGAIRVRGDRLYPTREAAQEHTRKALPLPPRRKPPPQPPRLLPPQPLRRLRRPPWPPAPR